MSVGEMSYPKLAESLRQCRPRKFENSYISGVFHTRFEAKTNITKKWLLYEKKIKAKINDSMFLKHIYEIF